MYRRKDILNAREKRVEIQSDLIDKYKMTLVAIRVNYPGINKDNSLSQKIHSIILNIVKSIFDVHIYYTLIMYTEEGPIAILLIDKDALEVKKVCVDIEDGHTLGRCIDIDVYDSKHNGISRTILGNQPRKCYICNEDAHVCVRSQKHTIDEIIDFIRNKLDEYMENMYGKDEGKKTLG